jgi:hypothetical protein
MTRDDLLAGLGISLDCEYVFVAWGPDPSFD